MHIKKDKYPHLASLPDENLREALRWASEILQIDFLLFHGIGSKANKPDDDKKAVENSALWQQTFQDNERFLTLWRDTQKKLLELAEKLIASAHDDDNDEGDD